MDRIIKSVDGLGWQYRSDAAAEGVVSAAFDNRPMRERESVIGMERMKPVIANDPGSLEWEFPSGSLATHTHVRSYQISFSSTVNADLPYTLFKDLSEQSEHDTRSGSCKFDLRSFYSYVNKEEVEDFLTRKQHITGILNDLSVFLNKKYGVTESRVEHIADDYYGYDTLKVTPNFQTKDWGKLMGILRETMDIFFYPLGVSPSEGVIVSI